MKMDVVSELPSEARIRIRLLDSKTRLTSVMQTSTRSRKMSEADDLLATVESIHAAGLDASCWSKALAGVARHVGGSTATFEVFEKKPLRPLRDHARMRGVSINTAYSHLRQTEEKTGTHRMTTLVRRLNELRTLLPRNLLSPRR